MSANDSAEQNRSAHDDALPDDWHRDDDPDAIPTLVYEHESGTRVEIWREAPAHEQTLRADRFAVRWAASDEAPSERVDSYCHQSFESARLRAEQVIRAHPDAATSPQKYDNFGVPK